MHFLYLLSLQWNSTNRRQRSNHLEQSTSGSVVYHIRQCSADVFKCMRPQDIVYRSATLYATIDYCLYIIQLGLPNRQQKEKKEKLNTKLHIIQRWCDKQCCDFTYLLTY